MELIVSNGTLSVGDEIEYPTGRGIVKRIVVETREGYNDGDGVPITSYNIAVKPHYDGSSRYSSYRVYLHNPQRIALVNP